METDFGLYLRALIQQKGITYTKLEQILSKRTIKRMENGEQQPTLKSLNKIKVALKLSPEEVLAMHEVAARSKALNILETHHPMAEPKRKRAQCKKTDATPKSKSHLQTRRNSATTKAQESSGMRTDAAC